MSKEALRLALEALEYISSHYMSLPKIGCMALAAVEEALAEQPAQQEPVAYSYTSRITGAQGFSHHPMPRFIDSESWDIQPLYTSPPAQRKSLTDEEIWDEVKAADLDWQTGWSLDEDAANRYITFARAIEAKLKEKNQ